MTSVNSTNGTTSTTSSDNFLEQQGATTNAFDATSPSTQIEDTLSGSTTETTVEESADTTGKVYGLDAARNTKPTSHAERREGKDFGSRTNQFGGDSSESNESTDQTSSTSSAMLTASEEAYEEEDTKESVTWEGMKYSTEIEEPDLKYEI